MIALFALYNYSKISLFDLNSYLHFMCIHEKWLNTYIHIYMYIGINLSNTPTWHKQVIPIEWEQKESLRRSCQTTADVFKVTPDVLAATPEMLDVGSLQERYLLTYILLYKNVLHIFRPTKIIYNWCKTVLTNSFQKCNK